MSPEQAPRHLLRSSDSITATFMVFAEATGVILMFLAQVKTQVLNTYRSSLCLANLFNAQFSWRPGRVAFVVLANIIALLMLYEHILEFVEAWIKPLSVLLSSLASVIIVDYFVVSPRLNTAKRDKAINWAAVISIIAAVVLAHWELRPVISIQVITSIGSVVVLYPLLRMMVFALNPSEDTFVSNGPASTNPQDFSMHTPIHVRQIAG
jgi:cytosine permease